MSERQAQDTQPDDEPVLPDQTSDDTDSGWGERDDELSDDELLIREKPPHW